VKRQGSLSPKLKRPEREDNQSPHSGTEVKNDWSYTSTPLCAFMVYRRTSSPCLTVPFPTLNYELQ
jgi:hypothetical protein